MAVTEGSTIQITPDSLNTSYAKFRKELIQMPTRALDEVAKYMSRRVGVRGKETVGELNGDMQIGPYSLTRVDENGVTITGRTLETYLGSGVKPFEPNAVRESIYGSDVFQGDALKNQPITKLVGAYLFAKVGESFFNTLFTAKRNPGGKNTADLYDGFKTIADQEIKNKTVSTEKGNIFKTTAITNVNAVDALEAFYDAADQKLKNTKTFMFLNSSELMHYDRAYRSVYGSVNYNKEFGKSKLDGCNNCTLIGLDNIPVGFKVITPGSNMLIGLATEGTNCNFEFKDSLTSHFLIDFVATMYFGTQFESISKERILFGYDEIPATE